MNIFVQFVPERDQKGLKNKNLLKINNKHLIFYSIDQAKKKKDN